MMLGYAFTLVLLVALLDSPGLGHLSLSELNTNDSSVQQLIVNVHNNIRRAILASNMLKMNWSSENAASAQRWANTCSMKHSREDQRTIGKTTFGENIYMSSHPDPWTSPMNAWNSEKALFNYSKAINWTAVGHFTQMVWRRTNMVGCGMKYCNATGQYFYVCHYSPPGNFQGQQPYKEGPRCGHCPHACEDNLCNNPCPHFDKYANCHPVVDTIGCFLWFLDTCCPASCLCEDEID